MKGNRLKRVWITLIAFAAIAGVGTTTTVLSGALDGPPVITAVFTDASPIVAGNLVKASGVDIGTVKSVSLKDGQAVVQIELQEPIPPLHTDARATIDAKNLLGERFIALDSGSPAEPEFGGAPVLDTAHTRREVDIQDVLNAVDTPTSTALGALLTSMGEGVNGNGQQTAGAIKALAPAMEQSGELAQILNEHNALLNRLVDNAEPVAGALASNHGRDLDNLVNSSTQTLSAVAAQRQNTADSVRELPSTIAQARTTLARLSGVADPTAATLASLRPVTDKTTDISTELHRFSDAADPALASLQSVLDRGNGMLDQAGPLVHALRPAGPELRSVAQSGNQLSDQILGDHLPELMEFMKGWALATSDYDAVSHYFKAMLPVSPGPAGRTAAGPVPGLPDGPIPNLPLPAPPQLPLPGREDNKGGPIDGNNATGLTRDQENSLLGQLLGGH